MNNVAVVILNIGKVSELINARKRILSIFFTIAHNTPLTLIANVDYHADDLLC
jgi:hypothetical protein